MLLLLRDNSPKNQKSILFLLPVLLFIHLCCSEFPSFGDICCRDVCLLMNKIKRDGTSLVVVKAPQKVYLKNSPASLYNMTQFFKVIHRPCCMRLDAGSFSIPFHCTEGNLHSSTKKDAMNVHILPCHEPELLIHQ